MTMTIRMYAHEDTMAIALQGSRPLDVEVDLHGWQHEAGELVTVDGDLYEIAKVYDRIQTDDVRGNYILADLAEVRS